MVAGQPDSWSTRVRRARVMAKRNGYKSWNTREVKSGNSSTSHRCTWPNRQAMEQRVGGEAVGSVSRVA
jgi:hypothetical protein